MRGTGTKVISVLNSHFHQELDPDSEHAGGKNVPANHFRKVLTVQGSRIVRIRHGDEYPHPDLITSLTRLEIDAGAGEPHRAPHVIQRLLARAPRPKAH